MRTFWIILGVLVLVGVAAAIVPMGRGGAPKLEPKQSDAAAAAPTLPVKPGPTSDVKTTPERAAAAPTTAPTTSPSIAPVKPAPVDVKDAVKPNTTPPAEVQVKPAEVSGPSTQPAKTDATKPDESKTADAGVQDVIETALNAGNPPATTPAPATEAKVELKQTPVKIERKEDGTVLLDGIFTVKGAGTKESPYIAPWEMVVTAQETYDPGQKKDEVPGAVMFLDGKHVRLTGYVCFPMYVPEPKEMLTMLNQWDGCCIGVPPTPYDAVEVHLAKKVKTDDRYAVYGTVEGVFRVKPYLSGNWLIGLYLLEDATFKPSDKGGGN